MTKKWKFELNEKLLSEMTREAADHAPFTSAEDQAAYFACMDRITALQRMLGSVPWRNAQD